MVKYKINSFCNTGLFNTKHGRLIYNLRNSGKNNETKKHNTKTITKQFILRQWGSETFIFLKHENPRSSKATRNLPFKRGTQITTESMNALNTGYFSIPVFHVNMLPPKAWSMIWYANLTQPTIPLLALTKASPRNVRFGILYDRPFTIVTQGDLTT